MAKLTNPIILRVVVDTAATEDVAREVAELRATLERISDAIDDGEHDQSCAWMNSPRETSEPCNCWRHDLRAAINGESQP